MNSLLATVALTLFLLPCAIQDWRSHQISNWLTLPAFFVAWVVAFIFDNLPITMAVFLGCYVAWSIGAMGAADGKLAVLVVAVTPVALFISSLLLGFTFLLLHLLGVKNTRLPAALWFWLGTLLCALPKSVHVAGPNLFPVLAIQMLIHLLTMTTGLVALSHLWVSFSRKSL